LINLSTMSLDGLRAWIGEVERKLGARTRVFLVLLAIAIGASGAAIYLAIDADNGSGGSGGASAEEVQQLREQVELGGAGSPQISSLESQIVELRTEIEQRKKAFRNPKPSRRPNPKPQNDVRAYSHIIHARRPRSPLHSAQSISRAIATLPPLRQRKESHRCPRATASKSARRSRFRTPNR
jgi:hypothetical protein